MLDRVSRSLAGVNTIKNKSEQASVSLARAAISRNKLVQVGISLDRAASSKNMSEQASVNLDKSSWFGINKSKSINRSQLTRISSEQVTVGRYRSNRVSKVKISQNK